ncbi:MAG TPA: transporter [Candidatus Tectomicrobia bacterium]
MQIRLSRDEDAVDSDLVYALRMHPDVNARTRDVEDPDERQEALMNVAVQVVTIVGLLLLASLGAGAYAQDLEPRAYVNTPVGLNFLLAGYGYAAGGVATDPSLPLQNAHLQVHSALLAYARSLDVWGTSGKIDVVVPYAWLSGTADFEGQPREREVSGFADPRFRFSVNLYGAPALSLPEFTSYKQDLIIGASLQVSAPLGQYDADKLVNIGTNRWFVKPELGISKAWGPLTLELTTGVTLYTDNHDFLGGKTREQAPIYSVQGHVSYTVRAGIWVAVDGTYYTGGRTTVDGVEGNDLQKNSRLGVTGSLPVNRHTSVKLYGSTGVSTRTGSNFNAGGIILQYRWGGGL